MDYFSTWFQAVVSTAWAVGFGVVAVIAGLFENWLGKKFRWAGLPLVAVGALLLLYASFCAWSDEHRQRLALETPPPKFSGGIIEVADVYAGNPTTTALLAPNKYGVIVEMWVENDGGPSTIRDWTSSALDLAGKKIRGTPAFPAPFPVTFPGLSNGRMLGIIYSVGSSVMAMAANKMSTWDHKGGVILLSFERPVRDTTVKIAFDDRTGKWTTIPFKKEPPVPLP
jgi:hypothetical protein